MQDELLPRPSISPHLITLPFHCWLGFYSRQHISVFVLYICEARGLKCSVFDLPLPVFSAVTSFEGPVHCSQASFHPALPGSDLPAMPHLRLLRIRREQEDNRMKKEIDTELSCSLYFNRVIQCHCTATDSLSMPQSGIGS